MKLTCLNNFSLSSCGEPRLLCSASMVSRFASSADRVSWRRTTSCFMCEWASSCTQENVKVKRAYTITTAAAAAVAAANSAAATTGSNCVACAFSYSFPLSVPSSMPLFHTSSPPYPGFLQALTFHLQRSRSKQ